MPAVSRRSPAAFVRRRAIVTALLFAVILFVEQSARADDTCNAAGLAVNAVYCDESGSSLLDRRIEFLRDVSRQVMDLRSHENMLEDEKGAIAIIAEHCALEPNGGALRACNAAVLIDRLYAIEAEIVATLDERLEDPVAAEAPGILPVPDGRTLAAFLASVAAHGPAEVFADPDESHLIGTVWSGENAIVTGVLLRDEPGGSLFRILWRHGTVAWSPVEDWRFDPEQLLRGTRNLPAPYDLARRSQRARLACIEAALANLPADTYGRFVGPWQTAGGDFYARLLFPTTAMVECVASPDPDVPVAIVLTGMNP
jgi:hypothetical protein